MIATGAHIYGVLAQDEAVSALVAGRVYPQRRAEGATIPCVVYQVVSVSPARSLAGPWRSEWERVQVDCYAATYAAVSTLANTVDTVLCEASPTVSSGLQVGTMRRMGAMEEPIEQVDGSDRAVHCIHLDYLSTIRKV